LKGELCGWFAPQFKILGDAWRELLEWLGPVISSKNEQDKRIELVGGGVIECWTLDNPDAGRSRKYHRVVVDEAGLVADLMPRWSQAIRPTLVDYRGQARLYGTPKGRRSGFVGLFNRGLDDSEPDWAAFRAATTENPHIPPEEIEAAKRDMTPEEFAQEFLAIPMDDGANPFGLDAIAAALGDLSNEPPVVYGADLARAMDYTVTIGLDAWCRVCRVDRWQSPWASTKSKIATMAKEKGDLVPVVADATGVGDAIVSDLSLMGVLVTPYVFTQPSKTRLMQRLITAFQAKTLTIPTGPAFQWLRTELEAIEYEYTSSGVKYCMDSATRVLTADAKWVPVGSVISGQELFGFDEHPTGRRRTWGKSVVVDTAVVEKPCYRLSLSDGTEVICSADHQWLVEHGNGTPEWRTTENLRPVTASRSLRYAPSRLVRLLPVWEEDKTYRSGYMAGVMDGEGCLSQARRMDRATGSTFRVSFAQRDNALMHYALESLEEMGVQYSVHGPTGTNNDVWHIGITGRMQAILAFLGRIQPKRLLGKLDINKLGCINAIDTPHVVEKEFLGVREVVALETTTRTFVAEGLASHNCAPPGLHDDGVMALALALHGWDRVQGAPPEAPPGLRQVGDDPYLARESEQAPTAFQPGDFSQQLPAGGW
jgi:hypothetical protein